MDLWFVGDAFLRDTFPTMQSMKTSASMLQRQLPFVYERFNVFYFFLAKNSFIQNILVKLHNAVVEGLNRREHLPKYIIFMPDEDFLLSLNHYVFGISWLAGTCVNWITKQIERLLDSRADQLYRAKPGAVFDNTKLIWIKMISWPEVPATHDKFKVYTLKSKLNQALDDIADKHKQTYVITIRSLDNSHFDSNGRLSHEGKVQMWKEIDQIIKRFDRGEIRLNPGEDICNMRRTVLPTPPPAATATK